MSSDLNKNHPEKDLNKIVFQHMTTTFVTRRWTISWYA